MVDRNLLHVGMFYKNLNGIGRIVAIDEVDQLVTIKDINQNRAKVVRLAQLDPGLLLDERMMWDCED